MIDLAILGLLKEQDLHGYELRKRVAELSGSRGVSFGSLYPALARLERTGLVKAVDAETRVTPVPSSGSLAGELAAFRARHRIPSPGGRSKKVYGITDEGELRLVELLTDPQSDDDRTFALKVAFCRFLEPPQRIALFERRRTDVATRLAERQRRPGTAADGGLIDRYLRSLREHDAESLTHDLAWLDRLLAAERDRPDTEDTTR